MANDSFAALKAFSGSGAGALARRAKTGRFPTSADSVPSVGGGIGALDEDPGHVALADAVEAEGIDGDVSPDPSQRAQTVDVGRSAASGPTSARSALPGGQSGFEKLQKFQPRAEPPEAREYRSVPADSFSKLAAIAGTPSGVERSARRDVNAIKTVTRLVQGIAFRPGSNAQPAVKTAELRRMLGEVHRAAQAVALAVAPHDAHRNWVMAACTEAMANLFASRAEHQLEIDGAVVDQAIETIQDLFGPEALDPVVAEAISSLEDAGYIEATSEDIAADRVRASVGLAAWELHDKVADPQLRVGGELFTYDENPAVIVGVLMEQIVQVAREMNFRSTNLDVRTMHMQGSVRRLASLVGAEYVKRTREIISYLEVGAQTSEAEFQKRFAAARDGLRQDVLPTALALARDNFVGIERIAPQLVEDARQAQTPSAPREQAQ